MSPAMILRMSGLFQIMGDITRAWAEPDAGASVDVGDVRVSALAERSSGEANLQGFGALDGSSLNYLIRP